MNYCSVVVVEIGRSRNSRPAEGTPRTLISFSCCASLACNHTVLYSSLIHFQLQSPIWLVRVLVQSSARYWPETAFYEVWGVCGGGSPYPRAHTFADSTYISSIGFADPLLAGSTCISMTGRDSVRIQNRVQFT